uniref:Uncharacterized protein n=1 Tax=viral metagenome TaxID=1070528 RepID=A0A6C0IA79_9ZZZZ
MYQQLSKLDEIDFDIILFFRSVGVEYNIYSPHFRAKFARFVVEIYKLKKFINLKN